MFFMAPSGSIHRYSIRAFAAKAVLPPFMSYHVNAAIRAKTAINLPHPLVTGGN